VGIEVLHRELLDAVGLIGTRAVLRMTTTYQPAGGPGSKVYPPTYPSRNGHPYVLEERVVAGEKRSDVLLDSTPSQANRAEEALLKARRAGRVELPLLELRHAGAAPVVLTSLEFPHRYADAYLRDSRVDGVPFDKTELGKSMLAASLQDATALYTHDPGSLVFGAWNSHRKGRQVKFPRVYASELVGWNPQVGERNAGRMDPLNLQGAVRHEGEEWAYAPVAKKVAGEKLSEIGHGNIAPNPAHGGVTITSATRMGTLSLAGLDRVGFGSATLSAAVAAQAVLASYALLADRLAFAGPSLWLRSGCELVTESDQLEWVHRGGEKEPFELTVSQAAELFAVSARHAEKEGLPISTATVELTPSPALAEAIDFSLTKAESTEG